MSVNKAFKKASGNTLPCMEATYLNGDKVDPVVVLKFGLSLRYDAIYVSLRYGVEVNGDGDAVHF